MSNIDFLKREVIKSFKYHIAKELGPRILNFIKSEVNIALDKKINELKNNDNPIKPQHNNRKSENLNSPRRIKKKPRYTL